MVSDMEELMCNDWVAVRYGDDWFPGSILQVPSFCIFQINFQLYLNEPGMLKKNIKTL